MKSKLLLLAIVALVLTSNVNRVSVAQTNWKLSSLADRNMKPEEKRLKDFWTGYYGALKSFYGSLDHLDWVVYYQNHGFKINVGAGPTRMVRKEPSTPRCTWRRPCSGPCLM